MHTFGECDLSQPLIVSLRDVTVTRSLPSLATPKKILSQLSLDIERGERLGVIGSNGTGKSTLLRLLVGTMKPDSGVVQVFEPNRSLLTLEMGFDPQLTGADNSAFNLLLAGVPRSKLGETVHEVEQFCELGDHFYSSVRTYSTGMRARLAFAIATSSRSPLLLIDEVLGVGDEGFLAKASNKIQEIIRGSGTVVVVSHSMPFIVELCSRAVWLQNGAVRADGAPSAVCEDYVKNAARQDK